MNERGSLDLTAHDTAAMALRRAARIGAKDIRRGDILIGEVGVRGGIVLYRRAHPVIDVIADANYLRVVHDPESNSVLTFRHACQVLAVRDSFSRHSVTITREQLEAWAGCKLADAEVDAIDDAIPNSSIPDAINEITAAISNVDTDDSSTEHPGRGLH